MISLTNDIKKVFNKKQKLSKEEAFVHLVEEVGEVARAMRAHTLNVDAVIEEIGDCISFLLYLASLYGAPDMENTIRSKLTRMEEKMNEKPYLADVQVGDKLYNFLERNKKYTVKNIDHEDSNNSLYPIQVVGEDKFTMNISRNGTKYLSEKVPYFLYAPVDVLDPKNLPPRPWKPKKDEWVWARLSGRLNENVPWELVRFCQETPSGKYLCYKQFKDVRTPYHEIAPFKGQLPPGLEDEI